MTLDTCDSVGVYNGIVKWGTAVEFKCYDYNIVSNGPGESWQYQLNEDMSIQIFDASGTQIKDEDLVLRGNWADVDTDESSFITATYWSGYRLQCVYVYIYICVCVCVCV
ncbi:hypothetical protein KIPB_007487 [Kipferlia bialata]|uniref:Uncharacterized protein n=1 Tax=Kipferlia bialata TaxID=797122 RepID=A0A9K3D0B7_9EUKA|nr:hypothetical protein KIPB_007487 [Kipferlia bialata]|eukprot:g7487.t1